MFGTGRPNARFDAGDHTAPARARGRPYAAVAFFGSERRLRIACSRFFASGLM